MQLAPSEEQAQSEKQELSVAEKIGAEVAEAELARNDEGRGAAGKGAAGGLRGQAAGSR